MYFHGRSGVKESSGQNTPGIIYFLGCSSLKSSFRFSLSRRELNLTWLDFHEKIYLAPFFSTDGTCYLELSRETEKTNPRKRGVRDS